MEYRQCGIGRTFVARLRDGESIYDEIEGLAAREGIASAVVLALGGVRKGAVVTGPRRPSLKDIEPLVERFDDARELVGAGTLFPSEGRPSLHFHAGIGRGKEALVGCPRVEATCFLVLEVVIIELVGLDAERVRDPETGFRLLGFLAAAGRARADANAE
jgi:predicted DNA-binding protein with PD1-like motif